MRGSDEKHKTEIPRNENGNLWFYMEENKEDNSKDIMVKLSLEILRNF